MTSTLPGAHTRPKSLRPRSTNIKCSARSFGSARSSSPSRISSSIDAERRRVPAIGCTITSVPVTFTRASGLEPTTSIPSSNLKRYIYGLGLFSRSMRYTSSASAEHGIEKRCESTIWKASPARISSFAISIFDLNSSSVILRSNCGDFFGGICDTSPASGTRSSACIRSRRETASA